MKRVMSIVIALFCAAAIFPEAKAETPLMFLPFKFGSHWWCPQANGGSYTHKGKMYWAFDFNKIKSTPGPSNPAYNESVYAPFEGTVEKVVEWVVDFQNNYGSSPDNNYGWGNMVLLRDDGTGKCVRICHFKQNSIAVYEGQHIETGTYLGKVGMTGWSTSPHVHIHLQAECGNSTSIPFKFIEGPVTDDWSWNTWKESEIMPRSSVLDDDNSKNLGNYFGSAYTTSTGYWQEGGMITGFIGKGYVVHYVTSNDDAKFSWNFTVKKTGFYVIFAKWTAHWNRDYKTKYTVFGKVRYRNQQKSALMNWHYIGWGYLTPYGTYQISVEGTTPGKYVAADGIILIKL